MLSLLLRQNTKKTAVLDNVRNLLGGKAKDFVTAVDEKNIIVVKELENDGHTELEKIAENMLDTAPARRRRRRHSDRIWNDCQ